MNAKILLLSENDKMVRQKLQSLCGMIRTANRRQEMINENWTIWE